MYKKRFDAFYNTLSKNTIEAYNTAMHRYEEYHKLSMPELIEEALTEQEQNVPLHQLKIYDRILDFREYLLSNYLLSTTREYESSIKNIYKYFRVEIPPLPRFNMKQGKSNDIIEYDDIIKKEELLKCLELCKPALKARVMCMVTGGYAINETYKMTVGKFIDDLYPHHQEDDVKDALIYLSKQDNLIWSTRMIRTKTKKLYYGFVNPETTQTIAQYLLMNERYCREDTLFKYNQPYVNTLMKKINDELDLGLAGGFSKFSPHMMRRYNATHLQGDILSFNNNLDSKEIDELQGRSRTSVQDVYMKTHPLRQKLIYVKHMNNVSLYNQYEYEIVDDDILVRNITHKKQEKLEFENRKLKNDLDKMLNPSDGLLKYIEKIGKDNFIEAVDNLLKL